jgi:hypothetical protein
MRKSGILVVIGLLTCFVPSVSRAKNGGFENGNDLLEKCRQVNGSPFWSFCFGYVGGIVDEMIMLPGGKSLACFPQNVTSEQLREVVVRFLSDHPELRYLSASSLATFALRRAFPC